MNEQLLKMTSSYLKAISHPTRLKILDILKLDELCVCTIYETLDLEQSNISQHLKILKDQGILESRRDGLKIMYKVKHDDVFKIISMVNKNLLTQLNEIQNILMKGEYNA